MRWGGVLLLIFIVFHILHFTPGVVGFQPGSARTWRFIRMWLRDFHCWPVSVFYIIAMAALCLHLDHGIWSMLQTLGWNTATEYKKKLQDPFPRARHCDLSGIYFGSGRGDGGLVAKC